MERRKLAVSFLFVPPFLHYADIWLVCSRLSPCWLLPRLADFEGHVPLAGEPQCSSHVSNINVHNIILILRIAQCRHFYLFDDDSWQTGRRVLVFLQSLRHYRLASPGVLKTFWSKSIHIQYIHSIDTLIPKRMAHYCLSSPSSAKWSLHD